MSLARFVLTLAGLTMLAAGYVTFTVTFLSAYLSGDMTTTIDINTMGEGHTEMMFVLLTMPIVVVSFVMIISNAIPSDLTRLLCMKCGYRAGYRQRFRYGCHNCECA